MSVFFANAVGVPVKRPLRLFLRNAGSEAVMPAQLSDGVCSDCDKTAVLECWSCMTRNEQETITCTHDQSYRPKGNLAPVEGMRQYPEHHRNREPDAAFPSFINCYETHLHG